MTNWIEDIESRPVVDKALINWPITTEFEIQGKFLVEFVQASKTLLGTAGDEALMSIAMQCSNILGWIEQMHVMGFLSLGSHVEKILQDGVGDPDSIRKLLSESVSVWLKNKRGQHKIGESYFTVLNEKFYHRSLSGSWTEIERHAIFDIFPDGTEVNDTFVLSKLHATYIGTPYDQVYGEWQRIGNYKELDLRLMSTEIGISSPESVLDSSLNKIKLILGEVPCIERVISLYPEGMASVEKIIKVSLIMARYVQDRRRANEHTIYLLRDCVMFNEIHHTLDIIEDKSTSHDQLYIGRKILSNKKREGGHWFMAQEILLLSCLTSPSSFEKFYTDYAKKMHEFEHTVEDFSRLVGSLAPYIERHSGNIAGKLPITIIDLGFQGSINMLLKYIIDTRFSWSSNISTDVNMFVVAEWFKSIYGKKRYGDLPYSLLTFIEDMARNEYLYDYNPDGLKGDSLSVKMGRNENQKKANLELIISTVTTYMAHKLHIL
jgi:hypothetical protein